MIHNLLVIDDNLAFLNDIELLLKDKFKVYKANTAKSGLEVLKTNAVTVVLLDLQLPDLYGLDVLKKIHSEIDPYMPVIIITEFDNTDNVVKAMRLGAFDFLSKDFNTELLYEKILKALGQRNLQIELNSLQSTLLENQNQFLFASDEMKNINFEITRISKLNYDILISGETGVGKDLIASIIHSRSKRSNSPFISVSLRSLSDNIIESELFGHEKGSFTGASTLKIGKFEAANHGTLYIPEISCLNENMQLKLLHFMQYKSISRIGQDPRRGEIKLDVRIIMATNDDMEELLKSGKLREDFYYRVSGVKLFVPPLRKRIEDIELLANYFLDKHSVCFDCNKYKFDDEVIKAFKSYTWPGNIRELENSIKNALTYSKSNILKIEHFPNLLRGPDKGDKANIKLNFHPMEFPQYKNVDVDFKRMYFNELWQRSGKTVSKAAKLSGLTPQGVRKILNQLGINNKKED